MKCVICKTGDTKHGTTTYTAVKNDQVVVIKGVNADVCENCGEAYFSLETSELLLKKIEEAIDLHHEVEVIQL